MTFLTPTLLAGDRSLVDVVAHELAHSWTGNLVTNATAEHFWLNEGFTVWAERRILRALRGEEAAALAWAIGQKALEESLERFQDQPRAHPAAHATWTGWTPTTPSPASPTRRAPGWWRPWSAQRARSAFSASSATTWTPSASRPSPPSSSVPSWRSSCRAPLEAVDARA